jgi:Calcineurin-like phosphoesterase
MGPRLAFGPTAVAILAFWSSSALCADHLFLVGDAGDPDPRGEPVLVALRNELARDPSQSLVVFLGDNIYPRGLPPGGSPERAEAERRIEAQIDAVRETGARALFVPGNHDWDRHGEGGWDAIRREAAFIEQKAGAFADFQPRGGCPGPVVVEPWAALRIVVLDTQWWLHGGPKPEGADSGCPAASESDVVASLAAALAGAGGRDVVVVAHHPLVSGGGHGGHFSWKDHVFPLRAWKGWLWLPLPVIGSAYPLGRQAGIFSQDITSSRYRHMLDCLEAALRPHRPLIWAAGHDHGLQVLTGDAARYLVVSGAGILGHTKEPKRLHSTLFASGQAGFVRLDLEGGKRVLTVVTVGARGGAREPFSTPLE